MLAMIALKTILAREILDCIVKHLPTLNMSTILFSVNIITPVA